MLSNSRDRLALSPPGQGRVGTGADDPVLHPAELRQPLPKGEIPWDLKAVSLFHNFMSQATDPAMFPAYLVGGMSSRVLRWGLAGQWVTSPAVKSLSGLLGRQLAASALALGGEAVAFTGTHRAARSMVENQPHLPETSLSKEVAGTAILLTSLRSFGFGAGMLGSFLERAGLAGAGTPFILSQVGAYSGLLAAGQAEHRLLYPEIPETGNPWLKAATSLVHFTGANWAAARLTPASWQGMEKELEQQTLRRIGEKAEQIRGGLPPSFGGRELAWQGTAGADHLIKMVDLGGTREMPPASDHKTRGLNFMWGRKSAAAHEPPPDPMVFRDLLPKHIRDSVIQIDNLINASETPFLKTLSHTKITDLKTMDLAIGRFHNILYFSDPESARSTYLHWIINLGLRRIVEKKDSEALDQLIIMTSQPTPMRDFENLIARQMGGTRLPEITGRIREYFAQRFKNKNDYYKTIEKLPLSQEAKKTLGLLLIAQKKGSEETPHYINPHELLTGFRGLYQLYDTPKWQLLQSVLENIPSSPLGILRLKRLHLVLQAELDIPFTISIPSPKGMLGTKLREMNNDQYQTAGAEPNPLPEMDAEIYLGPHGGFLGEHGPWKLLKEMTPQVSDLLDPVKETQRTALRISVLKDFLAKHPGPDAFKSENIAEAYHLLSQTFKGLNYEFTQGNHHGDFSFHVAKAMREGAFTLEALDKKTFDQKYHFIRGKLAEMNEGHYKKSPVYEVGFVFDGQALKFTPNGKPLIIITRPEFSSVDPQKIFDDYFEMLSFGIHEAGHLFEKEKFPKGNGKEDARAKEEVGTEAKNIWWRAQHGDAQMLRSYSLDSPTGFATRLLDWWEDTYRTKQSDG